ncbi:hypothetical protein ACIQJT_35175 [Streptomyces sp. NPDC091972]|uniref:hypothetical protein n=1 Tax=Streptomyces sp. NPDC091972 TaxID=3366007 RepID=UPI003827B4F2
MEYEPTRLSLTASPISVRRPIKELTPPGLQGQNPWLKQRHCESLPKSCSAATRGLPPGRHFDDTDRNVGWQRSDCGFLYPWRRTSPSSSRQQRDPVTAAAKLTVISEILDSPDPADAARRVFRAPHPATLRDFDPGLPPYMHRASPHLHELLSQALDGQAFAELSATRT